MGLRRNWTICEKKYWMGTWVLPVKFQSTVEICFWQLSTTWQSVLWLLLSSIMFWMVSDAENRRNTWNKHFPVHATVSTDSPSIDDHFYTLNHNFSAYGHSTVEACFQKCHWDCDAVWCAVPWLLHRFLYGPLCEHLS
jgi:hypothetical protein